MLKLLCKSLRSHIVALIVEKLDFLCEGSFKKATRSNCQNTFRRTADLEQIENLKSDK